MDWVSVKECVLGNVNLECFVVWLFDVVVGIGCVRENKWIFGDLFVVGNYVNFLWLVSLVFLIYFLYINDWWYVLMFCV